MFYNQALVNVIVWQAVPDLILAYTLREFLRLEDIIHTREHLIIGHEVELAIARLRHYL